MLTEPKQPTLKSSVDRFIFQWHNFPFDYWWRKRHGIAFGSAAHREMSFLDMYIEWREDLMITRALERHDEDGGWTEEDFENIGLSSKEDMGKVVHLTQKEIEKDYEDLDLEQSDKK